ncbi:glycosyltransferase family 39 protein [Coraliomargarita sp. W4R53]
MTFVQIFSKRDILFYTSITISLLAGGLLPSSASYDVLNQGSYWLCLTLFILLIYGAAARLRDTSKINWSSESGALLPIIVLAATFTIVTPAAYHVMQDEAMELNAALSMSQNREIAAAQFGIWESGEFHIIRSTLDKRPFFQAFLVSLLHDLSGYRVQNALYLNSFLSVCSLLVLFACLRHFFAAIPSALAVLVLGISPLYLMTANSYGFEMVNLFFLSAYTLALVHFVSTPGKSQEAFLVIICALLSYLRYESVILIVPAYLAILWIRKKRGERLHLMTTLSPLIYVPYVWLFRLSNSRVENWQQTTNGFDSETKPFALSYALQNSQSTFSFFTDMSPMYPNNFALFLLAGLGVYLALRNGPRKALEKGEPAKWQTFRHFTLIFGSAFGLLFLVFLFYFLGDFTNPIISRMSLPLMIPLCLLACLALAALRLKSPAWFIAPILLFATHTQPAIQHFAHKTVNYRNSIESVKQAWIDSTELDLKSALILDDKGVYTWTANRISSVRAGMDQAKLEAILLQYTAERFESLLLVSEEYRIAGGQWSPGPQLPEAIARRGKAILCQQLTPSYRLSIYPLQPSQEGVLFTRFWDAQAGKTSNRDHIYQAWNQYLLQNLPTL